jgi:hypothetical protein
VVTVNPLPKEDALNDGVYLISEFLVFSFAGTVLVYEYKITEDEKAAKSAKTAQNEVDYRQSLRDRFDSLDKKVSMLTDGIQHIEQIVEKQLQKGPAPKDQGQGSLFNWFPKR